MDWVEQGLSKWNPEAPESPAGTKHWTHHPTAAIHTAHRGPALSSAGPSINDNLTSLVIGWLLQRTRCCRPVHRLYHQPIFSVSKSKQLPCLSSYMCIFRSKRTINFWFSHLNGDCIQCRIDLCIAYLQRQGEDHLHWRCLRPCTVWQENSYCEQILTAASQSTVREGARKRPHSSDTRC